MDVDQHVDHVRVVEAPLRHGVFEPLVVPLGRESPRTLHATATGTLMRAPVAAITRTNGKTIFPAGSPATDTPQPDARPRSPCSANGSACSLP